MTKRSLGGAALAVAVSLAVAGVARADDSSDKAQLEQRVKDLEQELAEVKSTLRGGYFTANSDLEARVGELERMAADGGMSGVFKNGLKHESADGAFSYQFFGLIQNDWAWYWDDGDEDNKALLGNDLNPGVEFRRIRLGANGRMYGNVKWHSEVELTKGDVRLADVWMELGLCGTNIRVGHMKEPIGFDQITSDRYNQFMERSFVNNLSPVRNTGIMVHGRCMEGEGCDGLLYQVGMFRDADNFGDDLNNAKDGEYNFSARLAHRPLVQDDGTTWLHVGLSGRYSDISDDAASLSAKPAINQSPAFIGFSDLPADDAYQYGLEGAFVSGEWTFLGEWGWRKYHLDDGRDPHVRAWSAEAGYWVTGENTPYDKSKGTFGRTTPRQNFSDDGGSGAWQVALRHDRINLNDESLDGGAMSQWTAAVRWWLNPNTAVHLNVCRVNPRGELDREYVVGARVEIDF